MLSKTDCWDLMTAIKHLDHRVADQNDAILFGQIINQACGPTLSQCLAALAEWHTRHHDFGMIAPEDIVEIIKAHRPSTRLSEAEIGRMLEPLDLSADELWAARRALIANVDRGMPARQALSTALDMARGRQLPSKPAKPKRTHTPHFAGRLGKGDIDHILGRNQNDKNGQQRGE